MSARSSQTLKMLLIPVLGCVLVSLVFQDDEANELPALAAQTNVTQAKSDEKQSGKPTSTALSSWPSYQLDEIIAHNPFELPKPPVVPTEVATEDKDKTPDLTPSTSTELITLRVSAVVSGANGMMALVNNQMVRVGDTLDDSLVVVGIDQEAITVKRIAP